MDEWIVSRRSLVVAPVLGREGKAGAGGVKAPGVSVPWREKDSQKRSEIF
jgi:hypothetical protein